jgi:NitT/TauT family transport system substrate-binding protein
MRRAIAGLAVAALVAAGCASSEARARGRADVLRLGIFPNLTHAPGHVAIGAGIFERILDPARVEVTVFNSGSEAGQALLSGSIDATYIGPGPATSLYLESDGAVAVVSGAVAGGASFVVRTGAGIEDPEDLRGKRIAIPGIGNTQHIALRTWLREHGLEARDSGGDVTVLPQDNPELLQLFRAGQLDGAWEPEPYPSLLVDEGVAEVFVDEAELWPDGRFVTTHLLVSTIYLREHPEVVRKLVRANVEAIRMLQDRPDEARTSAAAELIRSGAPQLDQAVVDAAWEKLEFTWDPVISSLEKGARDAYALGYLEDEPTDIGGLYRLDLLHDVLADLGLEPLEGP